MVRPEDLPPWNRQKKKLKKVGDRTTRVPLTMSDLKGQGKEEYCKTLKDNEVPHTQVSNTLHSTKEVLKTAPLQMVFPGT